MQHSLQQQGMLRQLGHSLVPLSGFLQLSETFATAAGNKSQAFKPVSKKKIKDHDIQTPRQEAVIALLMSHRQELLVPQAAAATVPAELRKAADLHSKAQHARTDAWMRDMRSKCLLQRNALRMLPQELRVQAMQPDLSPYPPARSFFWESAPTAYKDNAE
jgi:hypothetical protein